MRVGAARALAPVVILAVFGLLVTGVIPASIWTWVATGLLWAAAYVAISMTAPERDEAVTPVGVLAATLVGVGFVLSYYLGVRLLATKADWGLAVIDAFLLAATVGAGVVLGVPKFRRHVVGVPGEGNPKQAGLIGPFGVLAVLFALMTSVFASFTLIADDMDLISLTARGNRPSFEEIAQLYIWQFCKSVPLLDINETLRWEPPFIYTGTGTGTLVLLYKIAVIIPVTGAFLAFWSKQVEDPKPETPEHRP